MGTNYYVRRASCKDGCTHCAEATLIHLGKSSMGWKFGFYIPNAYPREKAYEMWLIRLDGFLSAGGHIEDEYGQVATKQELLDLIEAKQHLRSHTQPRPDERRAWRERGMTDLYDSLQRAYFLCEGYDFCDREFS